MPKSTKKSKGPSFTTYLKIISNIVTIGFTTATTSTIALVSDAAKATTDLAVQPFNTLVRSTTKTYFAPQISYPDRSWSGMVESFSSRKRAWTGESRARAGSVACPSGTIAKLPKQLGPPPRSTSFPAHLTAQDLSIASRRQRRPELRPLDTSPDLLAARPIRMPSPLSPCPSPMLTPNLCSSPSSLYGSLPNTPRTPMLSASAPTASYMDRARAAKAAKAKFGGLEIARVSFWNLVGLGEGEETDAVRVKEETGTSSAFRHHDIIISCEEDDEEEEEAETYRKMCYI